MREATPDTPVDVALARMAEQFSSCPGPVSIVAANASKGFRSPRAIAAPARPANAPLSGPALGEAKVPPILSGDLKLKML
jgi:hypothetical protein